MLANDNYDQTFNNFSQVPTIPYRCIDALISSQSDEAEILWKLLKYNDVDCLSKDNLTEDEKYALIWVGDSLEQNYSVFIKPLIGSAVDTALEQSQLRIYRSTETPTNKIDTTLCYEFDFITNEKDSLVRKDGILMERTDLMESMFLSIMNGRDLGVGVLVYDRILSRSCSSALAMNNSKTYFGRATVMALQYINPDTGGSCS